MRRRILLTVVAIVGLSALLLDVSGAPRAAAVTTAPSATCGTFIAHRGEHSRWTENTLRAMKAAAAVGADYVEVDVRATKDSALILMHDRTINRTTKGSGTVSEMTLKRLRRVVLDDGTHITSLGRDLAAIKDSGIKVMLEVKWIGTDAGFKKLARQIHAFGIDRIVVTSREPAMLDAVHAVVPEVKRSLVTADPPTIEQAVQYGSVTPKYSVIRKSWLQQMRGGGYPVYAWTMNTEATWSRWNGRVDAITTDEAIAFARWRRTAECPDVPSTA